MKTFEGMPRDRLDEILDGFKTCRVAVIGDFFLDKYLEVDPSLEERSIETGKRAHQVVSIRHSPGAAGTVVRNLASLGAGELHAIGFTGDDGESFDLRKGLTALGCGIDHLVTVPDRMTPTYLKPRDETVPGLAGEHERYDTKNRMPTPREVETAILRALETLLPRVDAVIAMDQVEEENHGAVTEIVRDTLPRLAKEYPRVVFWADSRRRISKYRGVIIKANPFEAVGKDPSSSGREPGPAEIESSLTAHRKRTGAPVFITRGAMGIAVSDPVPTLVPGVRIEGPVDPTGAGDSVSAAAVLCLIAGASIPEAALIGNLVASITITQLGTTGTARQEDIPSRFALWNRQQER